MIIEKATQKIALGMYYLSAFFILCAAISPLVAEEEIGSEVWLLHPSVIDKCSEGGMKSIKGEPLAIDYSMHPYYLRIDLDGDGKMEYVVSLLDNSGWKRRGLMVCHEDGRKTIYRGIADREMSAEEKERIGKMEGILKDAVLIEGQTSEKTLNSVIDKNYSYMRIWEYSVKNFCYGKGGMGGQLIYTGITSSQAIPMCGRWYPLSKSEVIDQAFEKNLVDKKEEIAGEGIGTACELTFTFGFMEGDQFRWFIETYADPN